MNMSRVNTDVILQNAHKYAVIPKIFDKSFGQKRDQIGAKCRPDPKLGHGDQQNQLLPKKVEALAGQRVVAVSAGAYHSIALIADGAVCSWGKGEGGCLGHGEDLSNQLLPKKIEVWAPGQ